jgi:hypothetical protein
MNAFDSKQWASMALEVLAQWMSVGNETALDTWTALCEAGVLS